MKLAALRHPALPLPSRIWDPGPEPELGQAWFHPCPEDIDCRYCNPQQGDEWSRFDWSFVETVYCICLRSRPDRFATAVEQFHRLGLCQKVRFFRPIKGPPGGVVRSIWNSHRACLGDARARGAGHALVLEDDVIFLPWFAPHHLQRIAASFGELPQGWYGFYLGHLPIRSYFVRPRLVRTVSASLHAYIAGPRLIEWLLATEWQQPGWARGLLGYGLDSAFSQLPGMYAHFPMVAVQSLSPSDHTGRHKPKRLFGIELQPAIEAFGIRGGRAMQYLHVVLAPLWWTLAALVPRFGCGWLRRGPSSHRDPTP